MDMGAAPERSDKDLGYGHMDEMEKIICVSGPRVIWMEEMMKYNVMGIDVCVVM